MHLLSCWALLLLRTDKYAVSWVVGRAAVVEQGGEAGCLDVMGQSLCSTAFGEGCKLNVPGVGDLRRAAPNSWAAPSSGPLRGVLVSSADGEPLPLVPDCLLWLNFGETPSVARVLRPLSAMLPDPVPIPAPPAPELRAAPLLRYCCNLLRMRSPVEQVEGGMPIKSSIALPSVAATLVE